MVNQDDAKKRLTKGCCFSALIAGAIFGLVFITVCVITYIQPRIYEGRVVYDSNTPPEEVASLLVESLGLEQRWTLNQDRAVIELKKSMRFEGERELVVSRTDPDEAAEIANAWAKAAKVAVAQPAEANPAPSQPDIQRNLLAGLLAGLALGIPPAGLVLLLVAKRK